jgi:hypothetical protein
MRQHRSYGHFQMNLLKKRVQSFVTVSRTILGQQSTEKNTRPLYSGQPDNAVRLGIFSGSPLRFENALPGLSYQCPFYTKSIKNYLITPMSPMW